MGMGSLVAVDIYTTDTDSGQITVIRKDGSSHEVVKEIAVGNAPRGAVKFTRDGRGFVSNTSTNSVSEIDALTRREVARITVGSGPRGLGIVKGERYMLVSNSGSNTISLVDLETRTELAQIAVGRDPRHMALTADGKYAYVCIWGSGYIAKLDLTGLAEGRPETVREIGRINVGQGSFPYSLNIDRAGTRALVACNAIAAVPVIDLTQDVVEAMVEVESDGVRAIAYSPDNEFAYATIERTSSVAVIDMRDLRVTRYIPVGPAPRGVVVDEADGTIYCAAFARAVPLPRRPEGVPGPRNPSRPHSVTVIRVDGLDLSSDEGDAEFEEIRVGYGPCSVSIFDPREVSFDRDRLDAASAQLVEGSKTTV